jgi:hypothetical protein
VGGEARAQGLGGRPDGNTERRQSKQRNNAGPHQARCWLHLLQGYDVVNVSSSTFYENSETAGTSGCRITHFFKLNLGGSLVGLVPSGGT